ncbi:MAG: ACT domain-containing protein [Lachnospiraceae bacterium]|nr:ACT domain-containing protein [Lachnospiraceae bacterium]
MNRTIISVIGKDHVGIMAGICNYLAAHNINILDVNQSISQGFFHMIMIVDATGSDREFSGVAGDLEELGKEMSVQIKVQREEIFDLMHKI